MAVLRADGHRGSAPDAHDTATARSELLDAYARTCADVREADDTCRTLASAIRHLPGCDDRCRARVLVHSDHATR